MAAFDAHCHLDVQRHGSVAAAIPALAAEAADAGLAGAVVLPLDLDPLAVLAGARTHPELVVFACVNPSEPDCHERLAEQAAAGCRGLKLHPRVQRFTLADPGLPDLIRHAGRLGLPVLIDCFPWGVLDERLMPLAFDPLAKAAPEATIIMAHAGGIRLYDAMMVAKSNRNVLLDLSFSLLYFRGSSLHSDLAYVIPSVGAGRFLYGSDHPDRPLAAALADSLDALERLRLPDGDIERILHRNAAELLGL